ncbi:MAG TPA: SUMF1/EgtB/PvdO family nonheme iron enzyme [Urbifossiella sp.]|nr:SUMF1/EgtB/PvdO family nonheme iron enzyme [Urbifossiella sp.]
MGEPGEVTRGQSPDEVKQLTEKLKPKPVFAAADPVPGLSSWVLQRRLGGGGFGEVWLAKHVWDADQKPRAVKFCTDPDARHRLVTHERNVVVRVMKYAGRHPNIVPLLDCNLDGDTPWLMYEFVEGGTLAGLIEQWRELPAPRRLGRAVRTLHAIADALAACHRLDPPLVHRDLKPQNILMAGTTPRVTDFGIGGVAVQLTDASTAAQTAHAARLPSALHSAGTRVYAPPEQMLGAAPSPRDDVYALGVMAYQMVAGDLLSAPGADAALQMREFKVPGELAALIVSSVAMNPDRRPRDATAWEDVLTALIERARKRPEPTDTGSPSQPWVVPPPASPEPVISRPNTAPPARPRRRMALVAGGALVLALVTAGAVVLLRPSPRPESSAPAVAADAARTEPKGSPSPLPPGPTPAPSAPTVPRPGETRDVEIAAGVKMTFCWVPAGESQLGSPKAELDAIERQGAKGLSGDGEKRGRFKTDGFWLGKYEVTQAEWTAVMGYNPSHFNGTNPNAAKGLDTSRFPLENVSWDTICRSGGFLDRASAHGGVAKAFGRPGRLALPHSNAWEYACRGGLGNARPFPFGHELNGTQANMNGSLPFGTTVKGPNLQRTVPVGLYEAKFPHPWGLCDMAGNVRELCDTPGRHRHRFPAEAVAR